MGVEVPLIELPSVVTFVMVDYDNTQEKKVIRRHVVKLEGVSVYSRSS